MGQQLRPWILAVVLVTSLYVECGCVLRMVIKPAHSSPGGGTLYAPTAY